MAKNKKRASKKTEKGKVSKQPYWRLTLKDNWRKRSPVFKFVSAFTVGIIIFYSLYNSTFFNIYIADPLTHFQARLSSSILNIMGQATSAEGNVLRNSYTALDIKKGCDGIEPTMFFIIGVLLVPFNWRAKRYGLLVGLVALFSLNLLRIVGLYFAKVYWPSAFDTLHIHGGFALFFIITIIIWMTWANWALKNTSLEKTGHA